jgi:hypothetical protein
MPEEKEASPATGDAPNTQKVNTDKRSGAVNLPEIISLGELLEANLPERPEIIKGVLSQRCKMGLGGAAKARKTWQLIDLAISLAAGTPWLAFETVSCKVLYVNLELHDDTFRKRFKLICEAKEIKTAEVRNQIGYLGLRGHATGYETLAPIIIEKAKDIGFGAIILDPQYKILGDSDENSSRDMTKLYNKLDEICRETGAALILAQHYGKGSKSKTQDGDRVRGSSATIGDLDASLEFVSQEEADETSHILTVKTKLREFPPIEEFCIEWDGSAVFNVSGHNPAKLKEANGRPAQYTSKQILEVLGNRGPITKEDLKTACINDLDMSQPTFYRLWKEIWPKGASESEHVLYNKEAKTYTVHSIGLN